MNDNTRALVNYRMEQSTSALASANTLLDAGLFRDSVNRAYYSAFYAVLALLCMKGLGTSKHSGAIALFDREFVKPGVFTKSLSVFLHKAFDMRQEADYSEMSAIDEQDAREAILGAEDFVSQIRLNLDGG